MPSALVSRVPAAYEAIMARFFLARLNLFPWWYDWRHRLRHRRDMLDKFGLVPTAGHQVNDCRGEDHTIMAVDPSDPDTVTLDDGFVCSLWHCCDPVDATRYRVSDLTRV
jgi:hypothetical protein